MSTLKLIRYRDEKRRFLVNRRENQRTFLKWVLCRSNNKKIFPTLLQDFNFDKYYPILEVQADTKKFNLSIVGHNPNKYIYNNLYYQSIAKWSNESYAQFLKEYWIQSKLKYLVERYNFRLVSQNKYKLFAILKVFDKHYSVYSQIKLDKQKFFCRKLNLNIYNYFTYKKPNFSITRIRNQCRKTGEMSAILRVFRLSRKSFMNTMKNTNRFVGVHNSASKSTRAKHRLSQLTRY